MLSVPKAVLCTKAGAAARRVPLRTTYGGGQLNQNKSTPPKPERMDDGCGIAAGTIL